MGDYIILTSDAMRDLARLIPAPRNGAESEGAEARRQFHQLYRPESKYDTYRLPREIVSALWRSRLLPRVVSIENSDPGLLALAIAWRKNVK